MVKFISSLDGKRVLVTGAAGFIGSNITDYLLNIGAYVIGIDNLYNGKLENISTALKNENFKFYKADIRDLSFLLQICESIDIIYHQAAFTSVPESIKMPYLCNDVNINGTFNILECARKHDIKSLIFASTAAVYGDNLNLPWKEIMNPIPISPYGASKLACEKYLYTYYKIYGLNTVILRYMNVYGPKQDVSPYSGVISKWLGRFKRSEDLIIYGDGEQQRDFIYIKDIIEANILASTTKNIGGEVFNIGVGSNITINELANIMKEMWGNNTIKIIYSDPRVGDIKEGSADNSKARSGLKFTPKYDIKTGLKDYIYWYKSNNSSN